MGGMKEDQAPGLAWIHLPHLKRTAAGGPPRPLALTGTTNAPLHIHQLRLREVIEHHGLGVATAPRTRLVPTPSRESPSAQRGAVCLPDASGR